MKIVINNCFGGFGLSHKAVIKYAELSGFKLYPFINKRDANGSLVFDEFEPYTEGNSFLVNYSKTPLKNGKYDDGSYFSPMDIERNDPILVRVVKELKSSANGRCAELKIVKIPDGIEWEIAEYDGDETVEEKHKSWC